MHEFLFVVDVTVVAVAVVVGVVAVVIKYCLL